MNASQQTGIASLPLDQMPQLTSPGFSNIGSDTNTNQINITNTYTPFGSITKTIGSHTIKIGASLRKNQFNSLNPSGNPEGALTVPSRITAPPAMPTLAWQIFSLARSRPEIINCLCPRLAAATSTSASSARTT